MNFPKIAEQVIEKLGGKGNIATAAHCATRLRMVLNDESKVDKEGIDAIEGGKGQFSVARQYQIIFGSGTVNKVHEELIKQLDIGDVSKAEVAEAAASNQGLLQRLVKGLADIFVPIIPAIVAGGLLMGPFHAYFRRILLGGTFRRHEISGDFRFGRFHQHYRECAFCVFAGVAWFLRDSQIRR